MKKIYKTPIVSVTYVETEVMIALSIEKDSEKSIDTQWVKDEDCNESNISYDVWKDDWNKKEE
ncbi:MAG: hypothetical protein K6F94_00590 [Bacteroidaceae bacterium]|nr:hypothetical protein [Bacteroidaceae bacterium]